jgi:hypothetical protein
VPMQWVMSSTNDLATRKTGVKMTGFQSKRQMAEDKLQGVEVDLQTILLKSIKDLTMQVEALKTRINRLEDKQRDDGK